MKVSVIIQARMGSHRFPGKSLFKIKGKAVLEHVIDSVTQSVDRKMIFVATSIAEENRAIQEYCINNSIEVYLGDEDNVASRFYEIVQNSAIDYFIRLSGDSPLLDYRIIQLALDRLNEESEPPDLITTISNRSYPSGSNVEIVKASTFLNNYPHFSQPGHFEHVTKYFYQEKSRFNICYLEAGMDNGRSYKFSFDTYEDLKIIEQIFEMMDDEHYTYTLDEKCRIYDKVRSRFAI